MKAMAMVSPTTRIQKSPFAAPATASTLSSDIDTSATTICDERRAEGHRCCGLHAD